MNLEEILNKPYYLIDILPERAPADKHYFAVRDSYLDKQLPVFKEKIKDVIMKAYCYFDYQFYDHEKDCWIKDFDTDELLKMLDNKEVGILIEDKAYLYLDDQDHYLTFYDLDHSAVGIFKSLSESNGLFFRKRDV